MEESESILNNVPPTDDVRERILVSAGRLIALGGREAATTRAVAAAAGVQAPTIYRLFGDKEGLLNAVAEHGLLAYAAAKGKHDPHTDPVQELREGWDMHIAFGLAHPVLFAIMSGNHEMRRLSPAIKAGREVLCRRIRNIARAGRLRVSEGRAISMVQSVGTGTVLTLLSEPEAQRDPDLSKASREMVIAAITSEFVSPANAGHREAAAALRARLEESCVLTKGEQYLLVELLDRLADDGA